MIKTYEAAYGNLRVQRWENNPESDAPPWVSLWMTWTNPDAGTSSTIWIEPDEVPWLHEALQGAVMAGPVPYVEDEPEDPLGGRVVPWAGREADRHRPISPEVLNEWKYGKAKEPDYNDYSTGSAHPHCKGDTDLCPDKGCKVCQGPSYDNGIRGRIGKISKDRHVSRIDADRIGDATLTATSIEPVPATGHVTTYRFCKQRTGAWVTGRICPICEPDAVYDGNSDDLLID